MLELNVEINLGSLRQALAELAEGDLPFTAAAVRSATLLIQRTWMEAASGREVSFNGRSFTVKRVSGEYVRSIGEGLAYPDGDPLSGRVTADSPYARMIEEGVAARDLKPGLLRGPKARRAKDGSIYTIIPFQHGTPGSKTLRAMPQEVYQQARQLAHSQQIGSFRGRNAWGRFTRRYQYDWGGRLARTETGWRSRIEPKGQEYTHTTSIFSGMVRMGKAGQTRYMTFRVVSSKSPPESWWSPKIEARPIAAAVAAMVQAEATTMIRAAFLSDLERLGGD